MNRHIPIIGLALCLAYPAQAQQQACARRVDILKHLAGSYHEQPVAIGLSDNGSLLEILATTDGKTWTLLLSMPDGTSCLMATGQNWQVIEFKPAEHAL